MARWWLVGLLVFAGCGLAGEDVDRTVDAVKVDGCETSARDPSPKARLGQKLDEDRDSLGISEADADEIRLAIEAAPESTARSLLWGLCMVDLGATCSDPEVLMGPAECRVDLPGGFGTVYPNPFA